MWAVEYTDEFATWWHSLTRQQQEAVAARVELLAEEGPGLKRPVVAAIARSRITNLKELRCASDGSLRILFAFDPRRTVILLLGGDKSGDWRRWYARAIPEAERLYEVYLTELNDEGLL
jgi:hypothetical protein